MALVQAESEESMTCPHGIDNAACERCDEDVLGMAEQIRDYADSLDTDGREMYAEIERLRAAVILAARPRRVELWATGPLGTDLDADRFLEIARDRNLAKRLDRLRSALEGVLIRMGLMEKQ